LGAGISRAKSKSLTRKTRQSAGVQETRANVEIHLNLEVSGITHFRAEVMAPNETGAACVPSAEVNVHCHLLGSHRTVLTSFGGLMQAGRIFIERVNEPFVAIGGSGEEFHAGVECAVALGFGGTRAARGMSSIGTFPTWPI
jgi:hypothetical protein